MSQNKPPTVCNMPSKHDEPRLTWRRFIRWSLLMKKTMFCILRVSLRNGLSPTLTKVPPRDLHSARTVVAQEELDVLVYPDLGMDSLTYFMSFARLAPVQVNTYTRRSLGYVSELRRCVVGTGSRRRRGHPRVETRRCTKGWLPHEGSCPSKYDINSAEREDICATAYRIGVG